MTTTPTTHPPEADIGVGINVLVPTDLHRKIKARAALDGQTLAEVTEAAFAAYLTGVAK